MSSTTVVGLVIKCTDRSAGDVGRMTAFILEIVAGGGFMGHASVVGLIINCANDGSVNVTSTVQPSIVGVRE